MSTTSDPRRVKVGQVELAYETFGDSQDPPVVLVMGLGGQMHYWHEELCALLASRDLFVVRFDNRDVGLSTHLTEAGAVDLAALGGDAASPYSMSDLAADVVGLVQALGFASAHLVGISLGGMIVQLAAIEHPGRVRSLVSISSTSGDPSVGQGRPEALATLFAPVSEPTREAVTANALVVSRTIGSPGFELDEAWLKGRAGIAFDRAYDPAGVSRQAAAVVTAEDRTSSLRGLRIPALVVHGTEDPLVALSGGQAVADAIPDAELLVIDGMGHDLPRAVWDRIVEAIDRTVRRGEHEGRPG